MKSSSYNNYEIFLSYPIKVDVPNSIIDLSWAPIFGLYVVMCGSKDLYQKDMCSKENALYVQNMITILASLGAIIGRTYITIYWIQEPSLWEWQQLSYELRKLWEE